MFNEQWHILRELAKRKADIAALDIQKEKIRLWEQLNGLEACRPMVMIDQLPWHELNFNGELTAVCTDPFFKGLEMDLRRTLFQWKYFKADMVVQNRIDIPKKISGLSIGPKIKEDIVTLDPTNNVVGHRYHDMLSDEEALETLTVPIVMPDPETDRKQYEMASEIFFDILPVHLTGVNIHAGLWDRITVLRGANAILYDLADRPEFILKTINLFVDIADRLLDCLEDTGMLEAGAPLVHCTGAFTRELPSADYDGQKAKANDVWAFGMAQIFSAVSPKMHDIFEIRPLKRYLERFGLLYYGCCEPLDQKIDVIRQLKNLRKISISPWANKERAAEAIRGDYVFSNKPNPAFLAGDSFDSNLIKKDLKETTALCKKYGTPCELILKDVSTVCYKPERLMAWEKLAMDIVGG